MVGLSILAGQTRPVYAQHHMKPLDGHVMDEHVIGPLQKGGVNGRHRHHALLGHPRRHGHRVPLGNAHVKKAVWELLGKAHQSRAIGHGGGDGGYVVPLPRQLAQGVPAHGGKTLPAGVQGRAVLYAEGPHPVETVRFPLCRRITFPFYSLDVEQHRAVQLFGIPQQAGEVVHVMAVHRAQVSKAHILKHAAM